MVNPENVEDFEKIRHFLIETIYKPDGTKLNEQEETQLVDWKTLP